MAQIKKGVKLACVPCGRKIIVEACGISEQTIWCCGKPMAERAKAVKKVGKKSVKKG